jgi:hypothetical protein
MKVLIINFNRLTLPVNLANWVAERGCEPIFIDNNSDYLPLIQYYKDTPFEVVRMDKNYGHTVVWIKDLVSKLKIIGNYIVTDPDLDLIGIPDDFVSILEEGLRRYPQFDKCGFSLEINDLPNQVTIDWEMRYWQHPLDSMYFSADIDTTFALYKVNRISLSGIRTNRPYTAHHIPWYYDLYDKLPEDELYYYHTQSAEIRAHSNILDRKPGRW